MGSFRPHAAILVAITIWSVNFSATKYAVENGFTVLVTAAVRIAVGGSILALLVLAREGSLRVARRDVALLLGVGILGNLLSPLAFIGAIDHASASSVALIMGTMPVLVAVVAHLSGAETVRLAVWVALVVTVGGVALVAAGIEGGLAASAVGVVLTVSAATTWSLYTVAVRRLMHEYSPARVFALALAVAVPPMLAIASPDLVRQDWGAPSALAWASLLFGSVAGLVVANVIWLRSLHAVGPTRTAVYANLQPFLGALFAFVLLSEPFGLYQALGGSVIAAGILLAQRRPARVPARLVAEAAD
jgi:drug/metabolite transporter (DMT)-like permease